MRNISFINVVEFEIDGNILNKAITLGDVDNDNNIELIIGSTNGKLSIFKFIQNTLPWAIATDLGMIVCVDVGDICNLGMNFLITLSVNGWCHLFIVGSKSGKQEENLDPKEQSVVQMTPNFKQKLPTNVKICLIVDIDGDGLNELVVGYTDRTVRYFKWMSSQTSLSKNLINGTFVEQQKWTLAGQIGSISATQSKEGLMKVTVSQPGGAYVILVLSGSQNLEAHTQMASFLYYDVGSIRTQNSDVSSEIVSDISRQPHASFLPRPFLNTSAVVSTSSNVPLIPTQKTAAQVGINSGLPTKTRHSSINTPFPPSLMPSPLLSIFNLHQLTNSAVNHAAKANPIHSQPLPSSQFTTNNALGSQSNIHIVNQPHKQLTPTLKYSAICTLDGTLNLIDEDKLLWSLCVDHQLFSIKKLDVSGDGAEEVVVCSWDGKTYIVNLLKEVVSFQFRESVASFHAGYFSISKDVCSPCLIYITFNNKVVIYFNVYLPSIRCKTLLSLNCSDDSTSEDTKVLTNKTLSNELIRSLLYNYYD